MVAEVLINIVHQLSSTYINKASCKISIVKWNNEIKALKILLINFGNEPLKLLNKT